MNEYSPEQLVQKVNELARNYVNKVQIKAECDSTDFRGSEDYKLSFEFKFKLGDYDIKYGLNRRNGKEMNSFHRDGFITWDHKMKEYFLIVGKQKLEFGRDGSGIWTNGREIEDVRINDVHYKWDNLNANTVAIGWSQRIKDYLQQEIPEIMVLAFQKPVPRTAGLDELMQELEVPK